MFSWCIAILAFGQLGAQSTVLQLGSDEWVASLAWHPDGKRLYWATEDRLAEWPSGRSVSLPHGDHEYQIVREPSSLRFSPSGGRLLAYGPYTEVLSLIDLTSLKVTRFAGDCQDAWWEGHQLGRIRHVVKDEARTDRQYVQIGSRKKALPRGWSFASADASGRVLFAKRATGYMGPIALYSLDPSSLSVRRIRLHRGPFYVEYTERDTLAWEPRLRAAAIAMTTDTGATFSRLWISLGRTIALKPEADLKFIEGRPQWAGGKLIAVSREVVQGAPEDLNEVYRVLRIDPRSLSSDVILERRARWSSEMTKLAGSTIEHAAVSPDGKQIAWIGRQDEQEVLHVQSFGALR